mgnify:CR=1 FL=1
MMNRIHKPTLLSAGLVSGFLALTVGCQTAQRATAETSGIHKFIPPLSAFPGMGSPVENPHLTGAPSRSQNEAHAVHTTNRNSSLTIPPLPGEELPQTQLPEYQISPVQQVSAAAPATPQSAILPAAGPASASPPSGSGMQWKPAGGQQDANSCVPDSSQWRRQIEHQIDHQAQSLTRRLDELESELKSARDRLQEVTQELQASRGEIQNLQQEVARWKGEVRRLEEEMRAQQLADLKSLDELTETMHRLLLRQQQGAPTQGASNSEMKGEPK